jgi:hypothetical protein
LFDPEDPMKILPEKLKPVSRLGGITYGRSVQSVCFDLVQGMRCS